MHTLLTYLPKGNPDVIVDNEGVVVNAKMPSPALEAEHRSGTPTQVEATEASPALHIVSSPGTEPPVSSIPGRSPDATFAAALVEPQVQGGQSPVQLGTTAPDASPIPVSQEVSASHSIFPSQNDPSASSASVSVFEAAFASALVPHSDLLFSYSEEQSADHVGNPDQQVLHSSSPLAVAKPLQGAPTLLNIESQEIDTMENGMENETASATDGNMEEHKDDQAQESLAVDVEIPDTDHLPEPPASPTSNTLPSNSSTSTYGEISSPTGKEEPKAGRTPSANRLSISYAGGNRRLVVDAEVVETLKVYRQEGRIEVVMTLTKDGEDGLKGIQVRSMAFRTLNYTLISHTSSRDCLIPQNPIFLSKQLQSTLIQIRLCHHLPS